MHPDLPRVAIARHCWRQIRAELSRVAPAEGMAIPLLALVPRQRDANPCGIWQLADLERVVIARAKLVPPELQVNRLARVHARPRADAQVNRHVHAEIQAHPRLRAAGYLHSHPFARGWTRPSRGPSCDLEGHMQPLLQSNLEAGLAASFSFIACRTVTGDDWCLQCFALVPDGSVHDLGFAAPLADTQLVEMGLMTPDLDRQPLLRGLRATWLQALTDAGLELHNDALFDGWQRSIVTLAEGLRAVFLLPVDFPSRALQVHVVSAGQAGAERFHSPHCASVDAAAWLRIVAEIQEAHRVAA